MVPFPKTLSDPHPRLQGHHVLQRQITQKWYQIEVYLQWQTNIKSSMIYRKMLSFSVTLTLSDPDLKDTPLFDVEYLRNSTR